MQVYTAASIAGINLTKTLQWNQNEWVNISSLKIWQYVKVV